MKKIAAMLIVLAVTAVVATGTGCSFKKSEETPEVKAMETETVPSDTATTTEGATEESGDTGSK